MLSLFKKTFSFSLFKSLAFSLFKSLPLRLLSQSLPFFLNPLLLSLLNQFHSLSLFSQPLPLSLNSLLSLFCLSIGNLLFHFLGIMLLVRTLLHLFRIMLLIRHLFHLLGIMLLIRHLFHFFRVVFFIRSFLHLFRIMLLIRHLSHLFRIVFFIGHLSHLFGIMLLIRHLPHTALRKLLVAVSVRQPTLHHSHRIVRSRLSESGHMLVRRRNVGELVRRRRSHRNLVQMPVALPRTGRNRR